VRLQEPTAGADPSWFAALLRVSPRAPFTRDELVAELERRRVQTRMLFAGNMVRQPAFDDEMRASGTGFRVAGALTGTDDVMRNAVVVGCYPGLGDVDMDYIADVVTAVVRTRR
jgi:CDP-6-deoxy-D-xylo-4-hexulose-3-dehydrase